MTIYLCTMPDGFNMVKETILDADFAAQECAEQWCEEAAEYDDIPRVTVTSKEGGCQVFKVVCEMDPVFYASEAE